MPKAKEDYMPYLNRVARECRNAFEINDVRQQVIDRKSTRLNSSPTLASRMPSSA